MIPPGTAFDLIHVGKCGGTSVAQELRARGFRFEHVHLRRPRAESGRRYVVMARDPVARFVSAFNWRRGLMDEHRLSAARSADPIARLRRRAEGEFLALFENVNDLAERLVLNGSHEVSPLATMMQLIGHVPQGFAWYLGGLLEQIQPEQLAGVTTTERLADDVAALFGFQLTLERNRRPESSDTNLSEVGRANLAREFAAEYQALDRLAALASRAGVAMSVRYDPALGAVSGEGLGCGTSQEAADPAAVTECSRKGQA